MLPSSDEQRSPLDEDNPEDFQRSSGITESLQHASPNKKNGVFAVSLLGLEDWPKTKSTPDP